MSKKLLALVKWFGGTDDGKYTVGVPVEWIKSFNYDEYVSATEENTYVIEWHGSLKKRPLGGWECYDAFVVEVSDRLSFLKKKLRIIDGIPSPNKTCGESVPLDPSRTTAREIVTNQKHDSMRAHVNETEIPGSPKTNQDGALVSCNEKRLEYPLNSDEEELSISQMKRNSYDNLTTEKIKGGLSKSNKENAPEKRQQKRLDFSYTSDEDESGIVRINRDSNNATIMKEIIKGNQVLGNQLMKVCKELKQRRKRQRRDSSNDSSSNSSEDEPKVRIGPKKSGIYVTLNQWRCAKAQTSFTAMGISLLMALVPLKVLLRSNLKGGKSRIKGSPNDPKRQGLDKDIRDAIYYTVETNHPKRFNPSALGIAINNKLNSLRRAQQKLATETQPAQETSGSGAEPTN